MTAAICTLLHGPAAPPRTTSVRRAAMPLAVALAVALALPAWAAAATDTAVAGDAPVATDLSQSTPMFQIVWDARFRDDSKHNTGFANDARADTLRLQLGILGTFGDGWSAFLDGAGIGSAGNRYNSGANGQTQYPTIADPHGSELNQAWLRWQNPDFMATVGRQEILLDNQRWVGNVGWRQFEQTYDAVALQWQPAPDWTIRYDWLDHVYRVNGPDAIDPLARQRSLDTSLVNVAWKPGAQAVVGYAYLHKDKDVPTASTATYGLRWTGSYVEHGNGPGWSAEFARQSDYANNPANYTTNYWLLEPDWTLGGVTGQLGWEHLGGNGVHALQTPLATLHAFNGWDDQFTVTPAGGLNDRYAGLNGQFALGVMHPLAWSVTWHDFDAATHGHYGNEGDASLGFPLATRLQAVVDVARYRADRFGHNDTQVWFQLEWSGKRAL